MTEVKFKPYRHAGSIIYSPKNRKLLEGFAEALEKTSQEEKMKMNGRQVTFGGIHYLVVIGERKRVFLVSNNPAKARGTVFLAEE